MEPTLETDPPADDRMGGAVTVAAGGLAVLLALYELFTVGAGLTFQPRAFPGDTLHRVGFVAASAIDLRIGLAIVVAAVLAAWARSLTPATMSPPRPGTGLDPTPSTPAASATALAIAVVACVAAVLALLAVRASYHGQDLRRAAVTTAFHLSQATYVVGTVGPAALALIVVVRAVLGRGRRA